MAFRVERVGSVLNVNVRGIESSEWEAVIDAVGAELDTVNRVLILSGPIDEGSLKAGMIESLRVTIEGSGGSVSVSV